MSNNGSEKKTTCAGTENDCVSQHVCKVGVRISPFWPQEPALWFSQIEAQFVLAGITNDTTKFYHVIAQLDQQYASEVRDIITSPPADDKYIKLKTELINRLTDSKQKRIKQLLDHEQLGDRSPSQFLRHLRSLAGNNVPEDFLRTLWAGRLPTNVQTVIASQADQKLDAVAELADRICDIVPPSSQIAGISPLHEISQQIIELTKEVASLRAQAHSRSRDKYRSRSQNQRQRSRSRTHNPDYCWYHNRFGPDATKCTTPCSYLSSGNAQGSRK